jgi:predicted DNA-binding WGR domain protein
MDELIALTAEPFIQLAAINEARNVRRGYAISRSSDLFGWQVVTWAWGRLDRAGTSRTRAFPDEETARAFVRQLLARRTSAFRRIGVAYLAVANLAC